MVIDEEFVTIARKGRAPEKRFRFAGNCIESSCQQWTGERCGVIESVLASDEGVAAVAVAIADPLPHCVIRSQCRWFAEERSEACAVCPLVVTDLRSDIPETETSEVV